MTKGVWGAQLAIQFFDLTLNLLLTCEEKVFIPKMQYVAAGVWLPGGCVVCHAFCFLFWSVGAAVLRRRPLFHVGFECINEFISYCWFPAVKLRSLHNISGRHVYMRARNVVTKRYLVTREVTWPGIPSSCVKITRLVTQYDNIPSWPLSQYGSEADFFWCQFKGHFTI